MLARVLLIGTVVVLVNSAVIAQMPAGLSAAEQEVFKAEQEREEASARRDVATVDRMTDPDFFLINESGQVTGRDARVSNTGRNAGGGRKRVNDVYSDIRVKIYGDTALLTGRRSWTWMPASERHDVRMIKAWVKRPTGWRIVWTQYTEIQNP